MKKLFISIFILLSINVFSQVDALHYNIYLDSIDFTNQQLYGKTNLILNVGTNQLNEIQLDLLELVVDSIKSADTLSNFNYDNSTITTVSYTHLRAHETVLDLVCRLLLEKKNNTNEI